VAAAAAGAHQLDEVVELAAEEARRAVNAASLSISRWDRGKGVLRTLINVGELGSDEARYPVDETYPVWEDPMTERLLREGLPYFGAIDDSNPDTHGHSRLARLGKDSHLAVPIVTEGETWGEVYATTAVGQPRFRGEDVRFLEAVAGQLASAIGRAELFSRVSRLAYEDTLTGLANRRALEERLERAVARGVELSVVMLDVDELKAINDNEGHDAGDRALRRVADALVAASAEAPGSMVGRLAGDEFCVVMEGADLEAARRLAATTIEALANGGSRRIMVSCGAATRGPGVDSPTQLLRAADAALYRAKRGGGGQIFTAAGAVGTTAPTDIGERRALRRSTSERVRDALEETTKRLNGELADHPALDRVETVAIAISAALNAAAWAVSFAPVGEGSIHTVSTADDRDSRLSGLRLGVHDDVYPLDTYPTTERLLGAGSGTFLARRGDPEADPAEVALLEHHGRDGVLAAAAGGADGAWLVEIYSDEYSAPLADAEVELSLLVRAALPPRQRGRSTSGLLQRRTRQLQLVGLLATLYAGETDEATILAETAAELHAALGCETVGILRLRDDGLLELVAGAGAAHSDRLDAMVQPALHGLVGRCLRDRQPVLVADVSREPDYRPTSASGTTHSELDVPVLARESPWGAISVQDGETNAFDAEDVRLLAAVASQLGAALGATEHA
jgi:diguanylate cyclase (GGDEF)-like protein